MTPTPPYYTVVITTTLDPLTGGYDDAAAQMGALVETYPGFLGVESARDADGFGVSVSYWRDLEGLRAWRDDVEHRTTMHAGQESWYRSYHVRVARVEREYRWDRSEGPGLHDDEAPVPASGRDPS
jgi:heme-degrading monooxygenase HmoA